MGVTINTGEQSSSLGYKVYTALITQIDVAAPTAIILENTLSGTPVWSRNAVGNYFITLSNEFTLDKTAVFIGAIINNIGIGVDSVFLSMETQPDNDHLSFVLANASGNTIDGSLDQGLLNTVIEIRVYP